MKRLLAWSLLSFAVFIAGCGGGGGALAGAGGGGSSSGLTTPTKLVAKAPAGFGVPNAQLKLSGGAFAPMAVDASGAATVTLLTQGRQLVGVLDAAGDPVLMGFVSPSKPVLDTQSTATVLLYFTLGGFMAPQGTQAQFIEAIETDPRTAQLAAELEAALKANPKALTDMAAGYRTTVASTARQILARSNPAPANIDPFPQEKSGATVIYGTEKNEIVAKNRFRRRALMFVDQIAQVSNSGVETPNYKRIGTVELAPAKGTVYSTDILGNLGGAPDETLTNPIVAPEPTAGIDKLKLKAVVVGPGAGAGSGYNLSSAQQAELDRLLKKSFYADYLLGALNCVLANSTLEGLGPQQRRSLYSLMQETVDAQGDSIVAFVESRFPNAQTSMISGDLKGALSEIVTKVWTDSASQNAVAQFYVDFFKKVPDFPFKFDTSNVGKVLAWLNKAMNMNSAKDVVSTAINDLPQGRDWASSNRMETWDIETNKVTVSLTPKSSKIDARGQNTSVQLVAKATNLGTPPAGTVTYRFTTEGRHGTLRNNSGGDKLMIESAEDFVYYNARVGLSATYGTDDISVEVFVEKDGQKQKVGTAKASVEVVAKSDIELLPRKQSIKKNAVSQTISVKTTYPNLLADGKLKLRWKLQKGLGKLNVTTGQLTNQSSVTFTAGSTEGTETVSVDIVDAATQETLSTATATVMIEARTSIVYGQIRYSGHFAVKDGWYESGWGIGFTIPKVQGAKSYSVNCYNFNDTSYYGTSIFRACDQNGNGADWDLGEDDKATTTKGANGSFYFGLTGGSGFGPFGGGDFPDMRAEAFKSSGRFSGMIIEVTVTY